MENEFRLRSHDVTVTVLGQQYTFSVNDQLDKRLDAVRERSKVLKATALDGQELRDATRQGNHDFIQAVLGEQQAKDLFEQHPLEEWDSLDLQDLMTYLSKVIYHHRTSQLLGTKPMNRAQRRRKK